MNNPRSFLTLLQILAQVIILFVQVVYCPPQNNKTSSPFQLLEFQTKKTLSLSKNHHYRHQQQRKIIIHKNNHDAKMRTRNLSKKKRKKRSKKLDLTMLLFLELVLASPPRLASPIVPE